MKQHECNECTGTSRKRFISRRDLLQQAGEGMGGLALAYLLSQNRLLAEPAENKNISCTGSAGVTDSPFLPKPAHFKPRAKSVISLFMCFPRKTDYSIIWSVSGEMERQLRKKNWIVE